MKGKQNWLWIGFLAILLLLPLVYAKSLTELEDAKDLKKFLKANPFVLILFAKNKKSITWFNELEKAGDQLRGQAKLAFADCDKNKRVCLGKLEKDEDYNLKFFKQGKEVKEYPAGRPLKALSFFNFMLNPDGEASWEELETAPDVVHVDDSKLDAVIAEGKPTLLFFYSPSCVHCELMKPAYSAAASTLKGKVILAAIDGSSPSSMRNVYKYKLTGFPTIKYFDKGQLQFDYGGERTEKGIIEWLKNPTAPVPPKPEPAWSESPNDVNHLTDKTFDQFMKDHPATLVMFYAPWCGHCKNAKPVLENVATELKNSNSVSRIAAVDCTQETELATRFDIKGYPTFKYFKQGVFDDDYLGQRAKEDFLTYLDSKASEPAKTEL